MIDAINIDNKIFEKRYEEYLDELRGISMMAPSSGFGPEGIDGARKRACKHMIYNIVKDIKDTASATQEV